MWRSPATSFVGYRPPGSTDRLLRQRTRSQQLSSQLLRKEPWPLKKRFRQIGLDCTNGANSLAALRQAGTANLRGKILIHVGNPLDTSKGMPPTLTVCNTDSLGEQVQREFPDVRVVKALNTVNCEIMIAPSLVPGDHELFICGNDAAAKREVTNRLCE